MEPGRHGGSAGELGAGLPALEEEDDLTVAEIPSGAAFDPGQPVAVDGWPARRPAPLGTLPPPLRVGAARLVVVAGVETGRCFSIQASAMVRIGRARDNDVVLSDAAISRHHVRLLWNGDAWVVRDGGSSNGLRVNAAGTRADVLLRSGDFLELGTTLVRFELVRPANELPRPPSAVPGLSPSSATTERHIHTVDPSLLAERIPISAPPTASSPSIPLTPHRRGSATAGELSTTGVIRAPFVYPQPPAGTTPAERYRRRARLAIVLGLASIGFAAMMALREPSPPPPPNSTFDLEPVRRWWAALTPPTATTPWFERAYWLLYPTFTPGETSRQ